MSLFFALAALAWGQHDLDVLVDDALRTHPSLAEQQALIDELDLRERAARAWRDPVLGVELSNVSLADPGLAGHPMTGVQLRLSQPFDAPGTQRQRQAVIAQREEVAHESLAEAREAVALGLAERWWDLAENRVLAALTRDHQAWAADALASARSVYEVGGGSQAAVLRWTLLHETLTEQVAELDRREAELRALLVRSTPLAADPLALTETIQPVAPVGADDLPELEGANPTLRRLDEMRGLREAEARQAVVESRPDPALHVGYRVRSGALDDGGSDFVSVGATVPLPVGSAGVGKRLADAHLAGADAVSAQRDAVVRELVARRQVLLLDWQRADERAHTYADQLVPLARQALETTLADYRVGQATLADLYQAGVQLIGLERDALLAATDTHRIAARLAALHGAGAAAGEH